MKTLILILALACSANAGQMKAGDMGAVRVMHLNEGAGTAAYVEGSTYSTRASVISGAWVDGLFGKSLSAATVREDAFSFYMSTTSGAISFWFKAPKGTGVPSAIWLMFYIVDRPSGSGTAQLVFEHASGNWRTRIGSNNVNQYYRYISNPNAWYDGKWHLVVVNYGSKSDNKTWIDAKTASGATGFSAGTAGMSVFNFCTSGGPAADCTSTYAPPYPVEEYVFWNKSLTQGEQRRIYSEGLGRRHAR